MYSKWLGEQAELIRELTVKTFCLNEFACVFVVCKNPQLFSLLSCLYSKYSIEPPYIPGTNLFMYLGEKKYRRIKVCGTEKVSGVVGYRYEECKGSKSSICVSWKPAEAFENMVLIAREQHDDSWVHKRDINKKNLDIYSGNSFPTIISTRKDFEYWLNIKLDNNSKIIEELGFTSYKDFENGINFVSKKINTSKDDNNLIWINKIPDSLDGRNHIVYLSPMNHNFDEFKYDIKDLILRSDNSLCFKKHSELSQELFILAKKYVSTTSISIWNYV